MGFLKKLFAGPQEHLKVLEETIDFLHFSIFVYLLENKYAPMFGKEDAPLWAVAVANTLTLRPPGNDKARLFYETNDEQIFQEALSISEDEELNGSSGGVSYLYAAEILYSTAMTKSPYTDDTTQKLHLGRIQDLYGQAERLGIWIPDNAHICASDDPKEYIYAIHDFAKKFVSKHTPRDKMTVKTNEYLTGTLTTVETRNFTVKVTTAKEGLLKKPSTVISIESPSHFLGVHGVGKLIYTPSLKSEDCYKMHDNVCKILSEAGKNVSLYEAIEDLIHSFRRRGLISEGINISDTD